VDDPAGSTLECLCLQDENKAKPYVMLSGGGDGVENTGVLTSSVGFNMNDADIAVKGTYRIKPAVLISGYWIKENWGACGGSVLSEGNIELTLKLVATQLGGNKVLGSKDVTIFKWQVGSPYTAAIDTVFNVDTDPGSRELSLMFAVDPVDGDVFVNVSLEIKTSMTGNGRYLVDLKTSNSFYFWVESVELARRNRFVQCVPGGPRPYCRIGGPDNQILCRVGGPTTPECVVGGPDNPPLCVPGGPDIIDLCRPGGPIFLQCKVGGPDIPIECMAGPTYDPGFSPDVFENGVIKVDMDKVPQSMKRAVSRMLAQIARERSK
jgi:hypothetical protein